MIEIDFSLMNTPPPKGFPWRPGEFTAKSGEVVKFQYFELSLGLPPIVRPGENLFGRVHSVCVRRYQVNTHFTFSLSIEQDEIEEDEDDWPLSEDDFWLPYTNDGIIAQKRFLWKKVRNTEADKTLADLISQFANAVVSVVYGRQGMIGSAIPEIREDEWFDDTPGS